MRFVVRHLSDAGTFAIIEEDAQTVVDAEIYTEANAAEECDYLNRAAATLRPSEAEVAFQRLATSCTSALIEKILTHLTNCNIEQADALHRRYAGWLALRLPQVFDATQSCHTLLEHDGVDHVIESASAGSGLKYEF